MVEELAGHIEGVLAAANGMSSSIRRCAASGIGGPEAPRPFASSAISAPTPPKTMTIAIRSVADSVPKTEIRATSKNFSMLSTR